MSELLIEGEFPPRVDEAVGLLRSSEEHDENCGIPHPADPDQSSRCTCGLGSRVERAEDLIMEELDHFDNEIERARRERDGARADTKKAREENVRLSRANESLRAKLPRFKRRERRVRRKKAPE